MSICLNERHCREIIDLVNNVDVEYGGSFDVCRRTNTLCVNNLTTSNELDNTTVAMGKFTFHTHPKICQRGRCTIPMPSVDDIVNVAGLCRLSSGASHVLFTHVNIWVLRVDTSHLSNREFRTYITSMRKVLDNFYRNIVELGPKSHKLTKRYIDLLRQYHVSVRLFRCNELVLVPS